MKTLAFSFSLGFWIRRWVAFKSFLFKLLTQKAPPIFVKPSDFITQRALADGFYEPHIAAFFKQLALKEGHQDFLIDIGANIGLSSCQSGKFFKQVHMYEPNPNCYHILFVNARNTLNNHPYFIYEFGLGLRDERVDLHIPKHNWGGAFVLSESNHYSQAELTDKDNFGDFDENNYLIEPVEIRCAEVEFKRLFTHLEQNQLQKGVVKIDVEGCELSIVNALLKTLPPKMEVVVVFENWSNRLETQDFINIQDQHHFDLYHLNTQKTSSGVINRFFGLFLPLVCQRKQFSLQGVSHQLQKGDCVAHIHPKSTSNSPILS